MLDTIIGKKAKPASSGLYEPLRGLFGKDFFRERLNAAYRDIRTPHLSDARDPLADPPGGPVSNLITTMSMEPLEPPREPIQNDAIASSVMAIRRLAAASFSRPKCVGDSVFSSRSATQGKVRESVVFNYKRMRHFLADLAVISSHNDTVFWARLWKLVVSHGSMATRIRDYYTRKLKRMGSESSSAMTLLLAEELRISAGAVRNAFEREFLALRFERYAYEKAAYARFNLCLLRGDSARTLGIDEVLTSVFTPEQRERMENLSALTVDSARLSRQQRVRLYCGLAKYILEGTPVTSAMALGSEVDGGEVK